MATTQQTGVMGIMSCETENTCKRACQFVKEVVYHNVCPRCGKTEDQTVPVPDFAVDIMKGGNTQNFCEACYEENQRIKLEECQRMQAEANALALQSLHQLPPELCTWDSQKGDNNLALEIQQNRAKHLFIGGENDRCKTRAAAINLLGLAKRGHRCRFYRFTDLSRDYAKVCKSESEKTSEFIKELLTFDLLMIDDIAKRRITETAGELLFDLVDSIYLGYSGTRVWMTSNVNLSGLRNRFENRDTGNAFASRLDRMIGDGKMIKIELIEKAK